MIKIWQILKQSKISARCTDENKKYDKEGKVSGEKMKK